MTLKIPIKKIIIVSITKTQDFCRFLKILGHTNILLLSINILIVLRVYNNESQ